MQQGSRLLFIGLATALTILCGCGEQAPENTTLRTVAKPPSEHYPGVETLDSNSDTRFVTTMQHDLSGNKNVVYAPTFLLAWDVLGHGKKPQMVTNNEEALLLTNSTTYREALAPGEYTTRIEPIPNGVKINVYFERLLPFTDTMNVINEGLVFMGKRVRAFGMSSYAGTVAWQLHMLHYENDERFIVRIMPANTAHDIILAKGFNGNTFEEVLNDMNKATAATTVLRDKTYEHAMDGKIGKDWWLYEITELDTFIVPVMGFNYKTDFQDIVGLLVGTPGNELQVLQATQRTAFILNQNGSKVESEAEIEAAAPAAPPEPERSKPMPKRLVFDKPFLVMLKKTTSKDPYLMIMVNNTDIMTTM